MDTAIRSPLKWYGGKTKLAKQIVELMPPHTTYVELFGGSGAVLFAKPSAKVEVLNDLNADVVNFMRVVRDPTLSKQLVDQLRLTPYARDEHECCRRRGGDEADEVERARCFLVRVRQSRNGIVDGTWRYARDGGDVTPFVNSIDLIAPACERLQGVRIENRDFEPLIKTWDSPQTLFFADPPYVSSTRVSKQAYRHEMEDADHERLLDQLLGIKGMVILSGYASETYDQRLDGWERIEVATKCWSSPSDGGSDRQKGDRTEIIWVNPTAAEARSSAAALVDTKAARRPRSRRRRPRRDKSAESLAVKSKGDTVPDRFKGLFTSASEQWATPLDVYEPLHAEFGFTLDVCADRHNAKCDRYFTVQQDGLSQDWGRHTCWMNPPYGRGISLWMEKAFKSSRFGATVVCLIPARSDTRWWHQWVEGADEVRHLQGRVRFVHPQNGDTNSAPFPSALVVYRRRSFSQDLFGDPLADQRNFWGENGRCLAPWLYEHETSTDGLSSSRAISRDERSNLM